MQRSMHPPRFPRAARVYQTRSWPASLVRLFRGRTIVSESQPRLTPGCAAPTYWGMAMANANNEKRAKGFLAMAHERGSHLTRQVSPLYIKAASMRITKTGRLTRIAGRACCTDGRTSSKSTPDDQDARAWLVAVAAGRPRRMTGSVVPAGCSMRCWRACCETSRCIPAATIIQIHLWDEASSGTRAHSFGRAFMPGRRPESRTAWHMPCHTYTSLARYTEEPHTTRRGRCPVDHAAMARRRLMPLEIHNYAHNNQWLCLSLRGHIGRVNDAIAVARNLVEQPAIPTRTPRDEDSGAARGRLRWGEVLTRYELWDDSSRQQSQAISTGQTFAERSRRAYRLGSACRGATRPARPGEPACHTARPCCR